MSELRAKIIDLLRDVEPEGSRSLSCVQIATRLRESTIEVIEAIHDLEGKKMVSFDGCGNVHLMDW